MVRRGLFFLVLLSCFAMFGRLPGRTPALAVPANDNLANAVTITTPPQSGIVAVGDNTGATTEGGENEPCVTIGATVWYTWTSPAGSGTVIFDTYGSSFDTVLAIYTGSAFPLTNVGCNDDLVGPQSGLTLSYSPSTTYRIGVGGFGGATGNVVLNLGTGADIVVTHTADTNTADGAMSLREAILLATGGTAALGRAYDAGEDFAMLRGSVAGAGSSDMIHFYQLNFPAGAPATITITSLVPLPDLNANGDTVSGVGAGVIVSDTGGLNCLTLSGNSNRVEGMRLYKCSAGVYVTGANNTIGGPLAVQRNVLQNNMEGIEIGPGGSHNAIKGNFIGTDATGLIATCCGTGQTANRDGILLTGSSFTTVGGSQPGEGNVISGNTLFASCNTAGVKITNSVFNDIRGNKIGTDILGVQPLLNKPYGIYIDGTSAFNAIGGTGPGDGNTIAFHTQGGCTNVVGTGVFLAAGGWAYIRGNSTFGNSVGIDNSANPGPPVPTVTGYIGGTVLGTSCPLCTVDLYDDAGNQGKIYRGAATADALGNFSAQNVPHTLANVTAIATDTNQHSSAFSAPFAAALNYDGDGLSDSADGCPLVAEDYDGFQDGDGCPDPDNDVDGVCDAHFAGVPPAGATCAGIDQGHTCFDPANTLSCPLVNCSNIAEDYDGFKDGDGCPEPDNDNDGATDVVDQCPGLDWQAGADGMFGSPQDLNHNGIKDPSEATLTTDDVALVVEDHDGVLDADGCHDSPGEDYDGDGFTDDAEALTIGTDPGYPCGGNSWPADLWDQPPLSANKITVQDLTSFLAPVRRLNTSAPNPNFNVRWDLVPGNGIFSNTINVQDMTALVTLAPPMLNGARALNGPACPMPSQ